MKNINGMMKLKMVVILLLLLMVIAIIGATIIALREETDVSDAYKSLSYDDQEAVSRFSNKLTDYTTIYMIFGFIQFAVAFGLFLLLFRLWSMKSI